MKEGVHRLNPLPILFLSLFVAMIGFGVTLPVLTFYTERLVEAEGASREQVALHVGALTAAYAFMQLLLAPAWGRVSDRVGRKWPLIFGIVGAGIGQILFAMATSLWSLYSARIFAGMMAAAVGARSSWCPDDGPGVQTFFLMNGNDPTVLPSVSTTPISRSTGTYRVVGVKAILQGGEKAGPLSIEVSV